MIQEFKSSIRVHLWIQPNASKNEIVGPYNDCLKIKIKAPPIEGRANEEIIEFFSKLLKTPKKQIEFVRGETGRAKVIEIHGITRAQFEEKI